jgi:hypothetical protein
VDRRGRRSRREARPLIGCPFPPKGIADLSRYRDRASMPWALIVIGAALWLSTGIVVVAVCWAARRGDAAMKPAPALRRCDNSPVRRRSVCGPLVRRAGVRR